MVFVLVSGSRDYALGLEPSGLNSRKFGRTSVTECNSADSISRDSDTTFKVKGQLVADVLSSQHGGTGATWRINTKTLSTSRGLRHIEAAACL